jgi:hypothetical protein
MQDLQASVLQFVVCGRTDCFSNWPWCWRYVARCDGRKQCAFRWKCHFQSKGGGTNDALRTEVTSHCIWWEMSFDFQRHCSVKKWDDIKGQFIRMNKSIVPICSTPYAAISTLSFTYQPLIPNLEMSSSFKKYIWGEVLVSEGLWVHNSHQPWTHRIQLRTF